MTIYIRLISALILLIISHASLSAVSGFTDRMIVKMKEGQGAFSGSSYVAVSQRLSAKQLTSLSVSTGHSMRYSHALHSVKAHVVQLEGFTSVEQVEQLAQEIMSDDVSVEYAEPDYLRYPSTVEPNDPGFTDQWHLQGSALQGLNLPDAWSHTTGSSNVVVAVVDTGILAGHADFDASRILPGFDFVSEDWLRGTYVRSNDGDGLDNDATDPGDWVTLDESEDADSPLSGCPVKASSWHGTHVAGTIGAKSNNDAGVSGVDWGAKILPVRVLGKCFGYTSDISNGIIWAAGGAVEGANVNAYPADVINLSLGGSGECSGTEQSAINIARALGATIVVAAGNDNKDTVSYSPGNCEGVITVGAMSNIGGKASYSNFGEEIDLMAPGGSGNSDYYAGVISLGDSGSESANNDHVYNSLSGTSMAAPHVSGLAGLMLSRNPSLTSDQIETILKDSARDFQFGSGCFSSTCGAGIADAQAAIIASAIPYAPNDLTAKQHNTQIELTWVDNSALETGFNIEYAADDNAFAVVATVAENITVYTHNPEGVINHYRIVALNNEYNSQASNTATVDFPLNAITEVLATVESNTITLTWSDNSTDASAVEIHRAQGNNDYQLLNTTGQAGSSYSDTQLLDGEFYTYKVRRVSADGVSEFAESKQIQILLMPPSNLTAVLQHGQVELSWSDNSNNEQGYTVERSLNGTTFNVVAKLASNTQSYSEESDSAEKYHYRVQAISNKSGSRSALDEPIPDSGYSNEAVLNNNKSTGSGSGSYSFFFVVLLGSLSLIGRRRS